MPDTPSPSASSESADFADFTLSPLAQRIWWGGMLAAAVLFLFSPGKFPADDGFFYLQIAHNIAAGQGVSFHQVMDTNGFHPLWQLICTVLALLNPGPKAWLIYLAWAVQLGLFLASLRLFFRLFAKKDLFAYAGATLLAMVFIGLGTLYLTEAFLSLFLLLVLMGQGRGRGSLGGNGWRVVGWGLLAGLTLLARLDNVFVIGALSFALLLRQGAFRVGAMAAFLAGGTAVVLPYLLWNLLHFGHFLPVSGVIKSSFPVVQESGPGGLATGLALLVLGYLSWLLTQRRLAGRDMRIALCVGSLLHFSYIALFQGATAQWYWGAQYLAVAMGLAEGGTFLWGKWQRRLVTFRGTGLVLIVLLILPVMGISWLRLRYEFSLSGTRSLTPQLVDPVEAFARELDRRLPPGAGILVYDTPGKLAWYSDLRIVPTDGLVNDYAYAEELATIGIKAFARQHQIRYLLSPWQSAGPFAYRRSNLEVIKAGDQAEIRVFAPLSGASGGGWVLSPRQQGWTAPSPLATWHKDYDQVVLWELPE